MIIRARESNPAHASELEKTPNILKDARGRNVSIRFRQTDHNALQNELADPSSEASPFVPLKIVQASKSPQQSLPAAESVVTITTPTGYKVSISELNDLVLLEKILNTLEKVVC